MVDPWIQEKPMEVMNIDITHEELDTETGVL